MVLSYYILAPRWGSGVSQAPLKGELAGPKGLTEGFCGRHLLLYETLGEFVQAPLGSPSGGAGRPNGLTEGVRFVEWQQVKNTNGTPFAATAARNRGMIATGNHCYLDSLRGAPPPEGAARGLYGFALVHSRWYSAYRG